MLRRVGCTHGISTLWCVKVVFVHGAGQSELVPLAADANHEQGTEEQHFADHQEEMAFDNLSKI